MKKNFISKIRAGSFETENAFWFIFEDEKILLHQTHTSTQIPCFSDINKLNLEIKQKCYIGDYENTPCFTVEAQQTSQTVLPPEIVFEPIRTSHAALNNERLFQVLTRAKQILHWDKNTRFCSYCGKETQFSDTESAKICPTCKTLAFPQMTPAVLALIWRENEILLARPKNFVPGIYSILAGFVEPGETLEDTVIREVKEEVGITVKNLCYQGSQPWPFPSNLMLGFIAEYESGVLQVDTSELEDAQWFSLDKLPPLPNPISLSRRMIDDYLASKTSHDGP